MDNMKIGAFIATLRKEKALTQQKLADTLGVTNKAVSKWERGDGYPEITIVPALAEALGISVDELLLGERKGVQSQSAAKEKTNHGQLRWLLEQALTKFMNLTLIALGLPLIGLIAFFTLRYTCRYPLIGYGVNLIFNVVSIVLFCIFYTNLKVQVQKCQHVIGSDPYYRQTLRSQLKRHVLYLWIISFCLIIPTLYMILIWYISLQILLILIFMYFWVNSWIINSVKKRYEKRGMSFDVIKHMWIVYVLNTLACFSMACDIYLLIHPVHILFEFVGILMLIFVNIPLIVSGILNMKKYKV